MLSKLPYQKSILINIHTPCIDFAFPRAHVIRAKTVNMAHNRNNKESAEINSIINNAIESISSLRDMQPAVNGNQSNPQHGQQSQPTIASEVVRLFPTFQQPATSNNYQEVRSSRASGGAVNQRRLNNSRQSRTRPAKKNNKKKKVRLIHKDIVFILNPAMNKVPTHQTRLKLESKSRIIHDFAFDRDWPEWRLRSAVEEEMPMLMTVEYEFLKVYIEKILYDFIPPHL